MSLESRLLKIYENQDIVDAFMTHLNRKLEKYKTSDLESKKLTEEDVVLITYGDSITGQEEGGLKYLHQLLNKKVGNLISAVHILPMFPYSSDDGFSVIDYKEVDKAVGTWEDVQELNKDYDLMFDAVINHISQESDWFKQCLAGDEKYKNYFIEEVPSNDYSKVVRPRTSPLFSTYDGSEGPINYWSTFSKDQVDVNYENVDAATDIMELLVYYASMGAKFIRLDAIGFLWKENGTSCLHHEKTHEMIKVMKEVLNRYYPETKIITETNVPHKDNISYFGNGYDEAQLVYQFPLPPLTLFSFIEEDATKLSQWADSLEPLTEETTYFNFLASHDGIGLRPTEGILTDEERAKIAQAVLSRGGRINYKTDPDGGQSPYELNVNYQDALTSPYESDAIRIKRFVASQILLMSVVGIPAIYIHSLLGSRNDYFGVETSGINRRINREKLDFNCISDELEGGFRKEILDGLLKALSIRKKETAFSPSALQKVKFMDSKVFSLIRDNEETGDKVLVLINVSTDELTLDLGTIKAEFQGDETELTGVDLFNGETINSRVCLSGLQCCWIKL